VCMNNEEALSATIRAYDAVANEYAMGHMDIPEIGSHADYFMGNIEGEDILDIGCGPGKDAEYFVRNGFQVTGIDLSDELLCIAKKKVPGANFIKMDMREADFPHNSFDGVWMSASFLHIPKDDAQKVLSVVQTVLRPGGIMFLNVEKGTQEKFLVKAEYNNMPRYISFYSVKELEELVSDSGFKILKTVVDEDRYGWIHLFASA
jgi:ubiquinone/menaquinone biosynthesis C-methylase UbiE